MRATWKAHYFRIECGTFKYDNSFGRTCDMNCVEDAWDLFTTESMITKSMLLYWQFFSNVLKWKLTKTVA